MKLVSTLCAGLYFSASIFHPKAVAVVPAPSVHVSEHASLYWTSSHERSEDVAPTPPAPAPAPGPGARVETRPPPSSPTADASDVRAALELRVEQLPICASANGPRGPGKAEVLFAPQGTAVVELSESYRGTSTGACITRRLTSAATPFQGAPFVTEVSFSF